MKFPIRQAYSGSCASGRGAACAVKGETELSWESKLHRSAEPSQNNGQMKLRQIKLSKACRSCLGMGCGIDGDSGMA